MNKHLLLAGAACLALATTASLATAGEHQRDNQPTQRSAQHRDDSHHSRANRSAQGFDHGMQVVPTTAGAARPAKGGATSRTLRHTARWSSVRKASTFSAAARGCAWSP